MRAVRSFRGLRLTVAEVGDRLFTPAGLSDSLSFPGDRDPMLISCYPFRAVTAAVCFDFFMRTTALGGQSSAGAPNSSSCLFDVADFQIGEIEVFFAVYLLPTYEGRERDPRANAFYKSERAVGNPCADSLRIPLSGLRCLTKITPVPVTEGLRR